MYPNKNRWLTHVLRWVSISCSTRGTRHVTLFKNSATSHDWWKDLYNHNISSKIQPSTSSQYICGNIAAWNNSRIEHIRNTYKMNILFLYLSVECFVDHCMFFFSFLLVIILCVCKRFTISDNPLWYTLSLIGNLQIQVFLCFNCKRAWK